MPPLHHYVDPPERDSRKVRVERVAKLFFRVFVGTFGLGVLTLCLWFGMPLKGWLAIIPFCGLLLGYTFGGDKWGARLFSIFTGHRIPEETTVRPESKPKE
jgi:hypothetical protein